MKFILHIISFLFVFFINQQYAFAQLKWDQELLEKANTAKDVSYFTEEEKAVVFYCNLVRIDPLLFKNTFMKHYIDSTGISERYVKSLLKTLENLPRMPVLYPSASLYSIAKTHATNYGKQGKTGHGDFNKRFEKYFTNCECEVAENCYYGVTNAFNMVMELLIDEGVSSLSHRKNMLAPDYRTIGVSISPHKLYEKNCVMDFSSSAFNN